MKKMKKVIITLLILLVVIFAINLIRNYMILKDIYEKGKIEKEQAKNYYLEYDMKSVDRLNSVNYKIYVYDQIVLEKIDFDGDKSEYWYDGKSEEKIDILEEENNDFKYSEFSNIISTYEMIDFTKKQEMENVLLKYLFKPITKKDGVYKIKFDENEYYINKETKLIEKYIIENTNEFVYKFEPNIVKTEDVQKPE